MLNFFIGALSGSIVSVAFICLFISASQADRDMEAEIQKQNKN